MQKHIIALEVAVWRLRCCVHWLFASVVHPGLFTSTLRLTFDEIIKSEDVLFALCEFILEREKPGAFSSSAGASARLTTRMRQRWPLHLRRCRAEVSSSPARVRPLASFKSARSLSWIIWGLLNITADVWTADTVRESLYKQKLILKLTIAAFVWMSPPLNQRCCDRCCICGKCSHALLKRKKG